MRDFTRTTAAVMAASTLALVATVTEARHQWGKYEWPYDGTEIKVAVIDNTSRASHDTGSSAWSNRVALAMTDWNKSSRINGTVKTGNSGNTACNIVTGEINVCNANYGDNGWLGIATITVNGNLITGGSTKLNDFYFAQARYNSDDWKQLVTCQEIGHDYGLGHQDENFMTDATTSCMEYTSWPSGNTTPNQHDYDQLEAIYTVGTTTGGGGKPRGKPAALPNVGNTPESWGTPVGYLPNGKPHIYERQFNGYRIITHVTWTIEAALEQGDHHGPRQHSGDRVFNF